MIPGKNLQWTRAKVTQFWLPEVIYDNNLISNIMFRKKREAIDKHY